MRIIPVGPGRRKPSDILLDGAGMHQALNRGPSSLASRMQRLAYAQDELLVSVGNSLKIHAYEVEKSQTLLGRFLALFTKTVDPDWIEIDGTRLMQILQMSGIEHSETPIASKMYYADVHELRNLVRSLEKD